MSLFLPTDLELRNKFDIESLIDWKSLPFHRHAIFSLRKAVEHPQVNAAYAITIRPTGDLWLIRCGKRGGIKKLWNFGNPTKTGATRSRRPRIDSVKMQEIANPENTQ